jgi:hypothetical protein
VELLKIRKLADKSTGERIVKFDPNTGEKKLVNPATPGEEHEPWPLAGVRFEGDAPQSTVVPVKYVDQAVREGWMQRVNERAVVRPAGRAMDEWSGVQGSPHTFIQCDEIVIKTVDGDFRYRVVVQPDKYVAAQNGIDVDKKVTPKLYESGKTAVVHDYTLERIDG